MGISPTHLSAWVMPRRSPQYVFAREYEKLREVSKKVTEDDLSDLAFLLRKILLDGYYQRAAKEFRFKPFFSVIDFEHDDLKSIEGIIGSADYFWEHFAYAKAHPRLKSKDISWEEFIHYPIGSTDNLSLTVRDLIRFEAYVQGSVHYRKPEEGLEEAMEKHTFFVGNLPVTLRALRVVALTTLDALEPLYELTKEVLT